MVLCRCEPVRFREDLLRDAAQVFENRSLDITTIQPPAQHWATDSAESRLGVEVSTLWRKRRHCKIGLLGPRPLRRRYSLRARIL